MRLNFDGCSFLFEKLFSFHVHLKFRLYFQSGGVVSLPIFFSLIGAEVVKLLDFKKQLLLLFEQLHFRSFNINIFIL